jgi:hypothetical protein
VSGLVLPHAANVRFSASTSPEMMPDLQLTAPGRPAQRGKTPSEPMAMPHPSAPMATHPSAPMATHPSAPMATHPSAPMAMPYAQLPAPRLARRRGGLAVVAVIAFVAAMVGGILIIKSTRTGKPQPLALEGSSTGSAEGSATGSAEGSAPASTGSAAVVAVAQPPAPDAALETPPPPPPVAADAAVDDEEISVDQPGRPTHHPHHSTRAATPRHEHVEHASPIDAAVAVETPPPPPKPDAAVVAVTKLDPPPEPPKPARTAVVPPNKVHKISGELPTIKGGSNGDVTVKMCIDEQGTVSSVRVITQTAQMPPDLTRALQSWRYQPYTNQEGKVSPACFVQALRVVVSSSD